MPRQPQHPHKAIQNVASQFEALFIQQMMKSMRDAVPKSELMQSDHLETYQSMADRQMAVSLSQQGGIGIARMLVEQMQSKGYVPSPENPDTDFFGAEDGPVEGLDECSLGTSKFGRRRWLVSMMSAAQH